MTLFDQHTHSLCSPDSEAPLRAMAEGARDHGMSLICFTDHVDLDDPRTGRPDPDALAVWPSILEHLAELRADPPRGIEIRCGIELGEPNHDPARGAQAAAAPELDFVLGSLHNLRETEDFYFIPYASEEQCARLNRAYLAELAELAALDCYDVMAHVGYTCRYMRRRGFAAAITAELYREELSGILRTLIRGGRGIEVNTSGLRQGGTTFPEASVLALYRELGGEIVTVGSDAHTPADAGIGVKEGFALLESLGFRYVAQYNKRKPEFIRI